MATASLGPLVVPALKAKMGDWNYYIAFLRFSDLVKRVSIAEEIHTAGALKELLQRGLTDRAPEIAKYLATQPQRFFNAIVVGTYGGHPEWYELSVHKAEQYKDVPLPDYTDGALGFLMLRGDETLFAIDGQHRVAGIRKALTERRKLGDEEVATIFIKGVSAANRKADPDGFERTRRLFTTLNSRAKAVSKRDIIALDEDDVIAITTRHLIEEHPLFVDKVFPKGTKSIPPTEKTALITIVGLYDALDALFFYEIEQLDLGKQKRPDDAVVKSFFRSAREWYRLMIKAFSPFKEMRDADPAVKIAGKYRGANGGHFLFRPLGFVMLHKVAGWLQQDGVDMKEAVRRLAAVPMQLNEAPWVGLVWDDVNKRMLNAPENRKAAEKLLYYAAGGNLADLKSSEPDLRKEISGLMNVAPKQVSLRRYVR